MKNNQLYTSTNEHWASPDKVTVPLEKFLGEKNLFDPCYNPNSILKSPLGKTIAIQKDTVTNFNGLVYTGSLLLPWDKFLIFESKQNTTTYVNPPYGRELGKWSLKIKHEADQGVEIISLTPARTDTKWFEPLWGADRLLFIKGRLKFLGPNGKPTNSATFPSVLAYFGAYTVAFEQCFGHLGKIIRP